MSRLRLGAFLGSLVASTIVLTLVVGPTFSAIPNPQNKKFYACMNKKTRLVKMLNYPKVKTCPKRHKLIKWNAKGNPGAAGAPGAPGAPGPAGPAGAEGITKIHITTESPGGFTMPAATAGSKVLTCPAGKVVGGGVHSPWADTHIRDSYPLNATQWVVGVHNTHPTTDRTWVPYAVCMSTTPGAVIASKNSSYGPAVKKAIKTASKGKKGKKKRR